MNVYIMDLDYMAKTEPNFLAMRISSYHKQMGDSVTLLRNKDKLPRKIERLYILRRDPELQKPSVKLLYHPNVRVVGIEHFTNWEPGAVVLACRPDYSLYPRGRDKFERADLVQLTDEHGHLLHMRQNDENVETNKDCVVTDENLWKLSTSDLFQALTSIKYRKNIYFLSPISLSRILDDISITEVFLHLNFAQKVRLQWINSYPFIEEKTQRIINFFDRFKVLHPHVNIGELSFDPKPMTTSDAQNLKLCFELIHWMKTRCWRATINKLPQRLDSVYVHYYEIMHNWSLQPQLSFFELIAQTSAQQIGTTIETYYCHPEWWSNEMFRSGIELYHAINDKGWTENKDWALWQYQDKYYSRINIPWEALLNKQLWY